MQDENKNDPNDKPSLGARAKTLDTDLASLAELETSVKSAEDRDYLDAARRQVQLDEAALLLEAKGTPYEVALRASQKRRGGFALVADQYEAPAKKGPYSLGEFNTTVGERMTEDERDRLESLLSLLDKDIDEVSVIVETPEEAAEALGVDVVEIEKLNTYFDKIKDGFDDDKARLEFRAFTIPVGERPDDSSKAPTVGSEGATSSDKEGAHQESYYGRLRYDENDDLASIVLRPIPYVYANAIYVLRNDDGRFDAADEAVGAKPYMREVGARRVFHNDVTGIDGAMDRVSKLLTQPFDTFNRED